MKPKILILRFSSLGDLILTTPFYRELQLAKPDHELHLVTAAEFAPLFEGNPHIHQLHALNRKGGKDALNQLATELAQTEWEYIFDLHQSLRSRLLLIKLEGWFHRLQPHIFRMDKRSWKRNLLLKFKINLFPPRPPSQREVYVSLLDQALGSAKRQTQTELFPQKEHVEKVKGLLADAGLEGKQLIALGPGASFALKRWPREYFLELAQGLQDKGFTPVIAGGPGEEEAAWLAEQGQITNLAGQTNFLETAALLKQCELAISNDSAIVHFAEAVNTPALALFGPTVNEFGFAPLLPQSKLMEVDLACRPCSRNGKGECKNAQKLQCLVDLSVSQVLAQALKTLG